MTTEERILKLIEKGYTSDVEKGLMFNKNGLLITQRTGEYKVISVYDPNDGKRKKIYQHQFIWYIKNKEVVEYIDHRDRNPSNNRIDNLRSVTNSQNQLNKGAKCYYETANGKFRTGIYVNGKTICRKTFTSEDDAINYVKESKEIYHKID